MLAPRALAKRSRVAPPVDPGPALGREPQDVSKGEPKDERSARAEHKRLCDLLCVVESAMSDWGLSSQNAQLVKMIREAEDGCE
jgi:hypothetical protein